MSLYHSLGTSKITASPFLLITSINEPIKAFSGAEATSTLTTLDTQLLRGLKMPWTGSPSLQFICHGSSDGTNVLSELLSQQRRVTLFSGGVILITRRIAGHRFSKFRVRQHHPEALSELFTGLLSELLTQLVWKGWCARICISNLFPRDASAAGSGTRLEKPCSRQV